MPLTKAFAVVLKLAICSEKRPKPCSTSSISLATLSVSARIAAIRSDTENVAKDIDQVEQGFGRFSEQISNFKTTAKAFVSGIAA